MMNCWLVPGNYLGRLLWSPSAAPHARNLVNEHACRLPLRETHKTTCIVAISHRRRSFAARDKTRCHRPSGNNDVWRVHRRHAPLPWLLDRSHLQPIGKADCAPSIRRLGQSPDLNVFMLLPSMGHPVAYLVRHGRLSVIPAWPRLFCRECLHLAQPL